MNNGWIKSKPPEDMLCYAMLCYALPDMIRPDSCRVGGQPTDLAAFGLKVEPQAKLQAQMQLQGSQIDIVVLPQTIGTAHTARRYSIRR